jgi:phytoene synthase
METIPITSELVSAFKEARALTKAHASSYYTSTLLFPPATRNAIFALYGLVRKADEIVDTVAPGDEGKAPQALKEFQHAWHEAYTSGYSQDPILYAASWVFRTYDIPLAYSDAFFEAMLSDTVVGRYETYADLEKYMYGSAAVIGLMLTKVVGTKNNVDASISASNLGYAMQLTNFLRDIKEDYTQRNRIYIPQEDLNRFGVTELDIKNGVVTPEFTELMKFEIERARTLYVSADTGIPMLAKQGQKPVRLARVLYSKILNRIEEAQYDIFSQRRYTTRMQKLMYALPILLSL